MTTFCLSSLSQATTAVTIAPLHTVLLSKSWTSLANCEACATKSPLSAPATDSGPDFLRPQRAKLAPLGLLLKLAVGQPDRLERRRLRLPVLGGRHPDDLSLRASGPRSRT